MSIRFITILSIDVGFIFLVLYYGKSTVCMSLELIQVSLCYRENIAMGRKRRTSACIAYINFAVVPKCIDIILMVFFLVYL